MPTLSFPPPGVILRCHRRPHRKEHPDAAERFLPDGTVDMVFGGFYTCAASGG